MTFKTRNRNEKDSRSEQHPSASVHIRIAIRAHGGRDYEFLSNVFERLMRKQINKNFTVHSLNCKSF